MFQMTTGAPGEVIEFSVRAVDQSGNYRRAVWSLDDNSASTVTISYCYTTLMSTLQDLAMRQEYFVLTPAGTTHQYTIRNSPGFSYNCTHNQTLYNNIVEFRLIQIIAGDIVSRLSFY